VQVFGRRNDGLSTPCGGRRPKSAKARSRGKFALAVLRALWGFDGGAGLEGGCNADRLRPADQPTGELEAYNRHLGKRLKRIK